MLNKTNRNVMNANIHLSWLLQEVKTLIDVEVLGYVLINKSIPTFSNKSNKEMSKGTSIINLYFDQFSVFFNSTTRIKE